MMLILFALLSIAFGASISSCQPITSSGEYLVTDNLTVNETCFSIQADNVLIDCQGNYLLFSVDNSSPKWAFYIEGQENISIKNCLMYAPKSSDNHILYVNNSSNVSFTHSFINGTYDDMFLVDSDGVRIHNLTLTINSTPALFRGWGGYRSYSPNHTIFYVIGEHANISIDSVNLSAFSQDIHVSSGRGYYVYPHVYTLYPHEYLLSTRNSTLYNFSFTNVEVPLLKMIADQQHHPSVLQISFRNSLLNNTLFENISFNFSNDTIVNITLGSDLFDRGNISNSHFNNISMWSSVEGWMYILSNGIVENTIYSNITANYSNKSRNHLLILINITNVTIEGVVAINNENVVCWSSVSYIFPSDIQDTIIKNIYAINSSIFIGDEGDEGAHGEGKWSNITVENVTVNGSAYDSWTGEGFLANLNVINNTLLKDILIDNFSFAIVTEGEWENVKLENINIYHSISSLSGNGWNGKNVSIINNYIEANNTFRLGYIIFWEEGEVTNTTIITLENSTFSFSSKLKALVWKNLFFSNNKFENNYSVFYIAGANLSLENLTLNDSVINTKHLLFLKNKSNFSSTFIYNNLLNLSAEPMVNSSLIQGEIEFNTSKTPGQNIVRGLTIGGNYWTNPSRTGYSDNCIDADGDSICDDPYMIEGPFQDGLPLAYPMIIDQCMDITRPGKYVVIDDIEWTPTGPDQPCINITSDDVIIKGQGHFIAATNTSEAPRAVQIQYSQNVTVEGLVIFNHTYPLYLNIYTTSTSKENNRSRSFLFKDLEIYNGTSILIEPNQTILTNISFVNAPLSLQYKTRNYPTEFQDILVNNSTFNSSWIDVYIEYRSSYSPLMLTNVSFTNLDMENQVYLIATRGTGVWGTLKQFRFENITFKNYTTSAIYNYFTTTTLTNSRVNLTGFIYKNLTFLGDTIGIYYQGTSDFVDELKVNITDHSFQFLNMTTLSTEMLLFYYYKGEITIENITFANNNLNSTELWKVSLVGSTSPQILKDIKFENITLEKGSSYYTRKLADIGGNILHINNVYGKNITLSPEVDNDLKYILQLSPLYEIVIDNVSLEDIYNFSGIYFYPYYSINASLSNISFHNIKIDDELIKMEVRTYPRNISFQNIQVTDSEMIDPYGYYFYLKVGNDTLNINNISLTNTSSSCKPAFYFYLYPYPSDKSPIINFSNLYVINIYNTTGCAAPLAYFGSSYDMYTINLSNLTLTNHTFSSIATSDYLPNTTMFLSDVYSKGGLGPIFSLLPQQLSLSNILIEGVNSSSHLANIKPVLNLTATNITIQNSIAAGIDYPQTSTVSSTSINVEDVHLKNVTGRTINIYSLGGWIKNIEIGEDNNIPFSLNMSNGGIKNLTNWGSTIISLQQSPLNSTLMDIFSKSGYFKLSNSYYSPVSNYLIENVVLNDSNISISLNLAENITIQNWSANNVTIAAGDEPNVPEISIGIRNGKNISLNMTYTNSYYWETHYNGNSILSFTMDNASDLNGYLTFYNITNASHDYNGYYSYFYFSTTGEISNVNLTVNASELYLTPSYLPVYWYLWESNISNSSIFFQLNNSTVISTTLITLFNKANFTSLPSIFTFWAYNNIFYNTKVLTIEDDSPSDFTNFHLYLNTSYQPGPSIINGLYMGGNFWINDDGTGYSEGCWDNNGDDICDYPYVINDTIPIIDYYPLTNATYKRVDTGKANLSTYLYSYYWVGETTGPIFEYNVSDDNQVNYTEIYVNGTLAENISIYAPSYSGNFSETLGVGIYNITIKVYDIIGNITEGQIDIEVKDVPAVVLENISITNNTTQTFNAQINTSPELEILAIFNINGELQNQTLAGSDSYDISFIAPITSGDYYYNLTLVYLNATGDNYTTPTYYLYADTEAPEASLAPLANITADVVNYTINYTITDNREIEYVELYINGTLFQNVSINAANYEGGYETELQPGSYEVEIKAYDKAYNSNSTSASFYIFSVPSYSVEHPTLTNNSTVPITVKINNTMPEMSIELNISIDGSNYGYLLENNSSYEVYVEHTVSSSGDYEIKVDAYYGNSNGTYNYTGLVSVDLDAPVITIDQLPNATKEANYTITYTVDDRNISYIEVYLNESLIANLTAPDAVPINVGPGTYEVKIVAIDWANNSNSSTMEFYVFEEPNISLTYPSLTNETTTFQIDIEADSLLEVNITLKVGDQTYNYIFNGSNNLTIEHTFNESGIYEVTLTVNYPNAEGEYITTSTIYVDLVNPSLEVSPILNYTAPSITINYTINASDDMNLSHIEIYLNESLNNISVNAPEYNNQFSETLGPGYYVLNITAYDYLNQTNNSEQSFYVFAPPTYTIVAPEITNQSIYPIEIEINAHPELEVEIAISGALNNSTIVQGSQNITFYPTFTDSGNYTFNITIKPVNAEGETLSQEISTWVDLESPMIEVSPAVNYTAPGEIEHTFYYNITDDMKIAYVEIYINGTLTNITVDSENYIDNISLNVGAGEYHIDMVAYDLANNTFSTNRTFYVFETPDVEINYPSATADENVSFNVTINTSPLLEITAIFAIDNTTYTQELAGSSDYEVLFNHTFNESGIYPFNLTLVYPNANGSDFYEGSIYVDLTPPVLEVGPIENVLANNTTIEYIINASDEMELLFGEVYLNETLLENITIGAPSWNYNNSTQLDAGYYNLTVRVYDKLMHATEVQRTFFIFAPPAINHTYVLNNTSVCINTTIEADPLLNITLEYFAANQTFEINLTNNSTYEIVECFNIAHGDEFGILAVAPDVNNSTLSNITYNTSYLNNITINITNPKGTVESPIGHSVYITTILPTNVTCLYNISPGEGTVAHGENITVETPGWINFTIPYLENGAYTFNVYCNHTLNASASANYTVNNPANRPPTVEIRSPSNGDTFEENESITFTVYGEDDETSYVSCEYELGEETGSFTIPSGETHSFSRSLEAGSYRFEVTCDDGQGKSTSDSVSFTVEEPATQEEQVEEEEKTNKTIRSVRSNRDEEEGEEPEPLINQTNNTTLLNITNVTNNTTIEKIENNTTSNLTQVPETPKLEKNLTQPEPERLESKTAGAFSIYRWIVSLPMGLSLAGISIVSILIGLILALFAIKIRISFKESEGVTVIQAKNLLDKSIKNLKLQVNGKPIYTNERGEIIIPGRIDKKDIKINRLVIWEKE